MSHHGREGLDESEPNQADWHGALRLIRQIAALGANPKRSGGPAPHVLCDRWLELNGFDCEASRRRQREQRAVQLDAEIERLRKEREAL